MKKIWPVGAIFILFVIVFIACTSKENLEQQKEKAMAHRNLGEAYFGQRNYSAALRELLKAEAMTPDDYIIHDDLGLAYYYKGDTDKAIYHFKKALAIKDDYSPARNNLGAAAHLIHGSPEGRFSVTYAPGHLTPEEIGVDEPVDTGPERQRLEQLLYALLGSE